MKPTSNVNSRLLDESHTPSSQIDLPISEREREAVWGLHGQIFYIAIRGFIYGVRMPADRDTIIADHVKRFIRGERNALPRPKSSSQSVNGGRNVTRRGVTLL